MKKLMLLGGSRYLLPVIEKAHKLGVYVITCDYLPDNIAHKYSDEYCNASVIDKNQVLEHAQKIGIDGIMSFACDPGVVTASYVAEKMGLPFQMSYDSTEILQDKGKFRKFLMENDFNCPHARSYSQMDDPIKDIDYYNWPVIVKPVDSAGSKGVTKIDDVNELSHAISEALKASKSKRYIIEDFLTFEGYHSSTDPFTVDGNLKFVTYSDQLFDKDADNPYTPAYIIWPSTMKKEYQDKLTKDIQRLMSLLGAKTGIHNIESCVADGKPYIMEVSPRGGGCKIAELQTYAYGTDLIEVEIKKALNMQIGEIKQGNCEGIWCEMIVHAKQGQSGVFQKLIINDDIRQKYIKLIDLSVKKGDYVHPFTGANMSLGDMFLKFESREELDSIISKTSEWLHILLK